MIDTIRGVLAYVAICGLAANVFVIMGLVSVATGSAEGSQVSKSRRLPIDSDAKVFGILFAIGAFLGITFGTSTQFTLQAEGIVLPALFSFLIGLGGAWWITHHLNNEYMARAERNLSEGHYREAMEDALEVARSSETMRNRAKRLASEAKQLHQQNMGLGA